MLLIFHIPNWFTDPLDWFLVYFATAVQGTWCQCKDDETERMRKATAVAYFNVLLHYLCWGTEENNAKPQSDQSPVWNTNHVPARYKSVLILALWPLPAVQGPADYTLRLANTSIATQPQQTTFPHDELLASNWNVAANGVLFDPVHILPWYPLLSKCHAVP